MEIHSHYLEQIEIATQVDWVYDFALPPLVLHALYTGDARRLKEWLEMSPRNAITVLDTHDGIGVIDVGADRKSPNGPPGLLSSRRNRRPRGNDSRAEQRHKAGRPPEQRQATWTCIRSIAPITTLWAGATMIT